MKKKKVDKKIKKEIPVEVKSLFGKFYVFSIILDLILLIFMPFALKKISTFFAILTLLMFLIIYCFMLKDFFKKRQHFFSDFIVSFLLMSFCPYCTSILYFLYIFYIKHIIKSGLSTLNRTFIQYLYRFYINLIHFLLLSLFHLQ